MKLYSAAEFKELTGLTKQRLSQLRIGYTKKRKYKNSVYEYKQKPKLKKGKHWKIVDGKVKYTQAALNLLKGQSDN